MTHSQLVDIAHKWVLANASCGVAFKEFKSLATEQPDVIGFGSSGHSVLVECKATRSDFLCDKNKPFRVNPELGMGSQRYYCCPTGLISKDELPEGWGLIYVDENGKARKVQSLNPSNIYLKAIPKSDKAEMDVMYSALRRLQLRNRIGEVYDGLPTKEYWQERLNEAREGTENSEIWAIFEDLIDYSVNAPMPDLEYWIENNLKYLLLKLAA